MYSAVAHPTDHKMLTLSNWTTGSSYRSAQLEKLWKEANVAYRQVISSRVRQGNISSNTAVSSWRGTADPCRSCSQKACSRNRWVSALMPERKRENYIISCCVNNMLYCALSSVLLGGSFVSELINKLFHYPAGSDIIHESNWCLQINAD